MTESIVRLKMFACVNMNYPRLVIVLDCSVCEVSNNLDSDKNLSGCIEGIFFLFQDIEIMIGTFEG